MLTYLDPFPNSKVLEVGAGTGYQAALLAYMANEVVTVELDAELAQEAADNLERLGYANAKVITGDGAMGVTEHAPFDRIIATASMREIPPALPEQLKVGGILVAPVGDTPINSRLVIGRKRRKKNMHYSQYENCNFVPLVSEAIGGWSIEEAERIRITEFANMLRENPDIIHAIFGRDLSPEELSDERILRALEGVLERRSKRRKDKPI
jgi:protein-L-isoaspartate O-methyltransferase